jgi:hypothetical protein
MHDWAVRPNDWNANLIVLGDFNLDRIGDPLYEAFVSTGLWPPAELLRSWSAQVRGWKPARKWHDPCRRLKTVGAPLKRSTGCSTAAPSRSYLAAAGPIGTRLTSWLSKAQSSG